MSTNTRKIMISVAVVGAAAAVAGMGTFGTFTSTTSGSEAVGSGTVAIALGTGSNSDLAIPAANIVPGDTIQRAVTLNNTGTADFNAVTLTTTAATSNLLTSDANKGLQLKMDACSVAWTKAGTTTPSYTCTGTVSSVLGQKAVLGATTPITLSKALTAGASDNLLVTMSLPVAADNTFQALSNTINFTFDATQRTGTSR